MKVLTCVACSEATTVQDDVLVPPGWWAGTDGRGDLNCPKCWARHGWHAVDWDGTLVEYHGWLGPGVYGAPIEKMVARVRDWLAVGDAVKIMTARAVDPVEVEAIRAKCAELFGVPLEVTDRKDYAMIDIWDDRAVWVAKNEGTAAKAEMVGDEPIAWWI
jgi:hypothetical protein